MVEWKLYDPFHLELITVHRILIYFTAKSRVTPKLWLHISWRVARNEFESYIFWARNSKHTFSAETWLLKSLFELEMFVEKETEAKPFFIIL